MVRSLLVISCEFASLPVKSVTKCPRGGRCYGNCTFRRKPTKEYMRLAVDYGYLEFAVRPTDSCFKGAVTELQVALFFMERGFYVFRSVSHTSPFDLVVFDGNTCYTVDVKLNASVRSVTGEYPADIIVRVRNGKLKIKSDKLQLERPDEGSKVRVRAAVGRVIE